MESGSAAAFTVHVKVFAGNENSRGALARSFSEAHFHSLTDDEASGKLVEIVQIC